MVVHMEKMVKSVQQKHTDLVQENNKNIFILNPVQRGNKMVKTTATITCL